MTTIGAMDEVKAHMRVVDGTLLVGAALEGFDDGEAVEFSVMGAGDSITFEMASDHDVRQLAVPLKQAEEFAFALGVLIERLKSEAGAAGEET